QKTKSLYMGDWIIAYPKIIILKPKGKKIVRMAARLPKGLGDGEYRSELVFEEQPIQSYNNKDKDSERLSGGVTVLHTLISTVYGYNGELEYNGNFGDFKLITDEKKTYFASEITNIGTTALDSFYRITYYDNNMEKLKTEDIALNKIMRENYKNFILELKKISKKSTSMKIEYYCKIESDKQKETEEYKIGEKIIPREIMSLDEYKKGMYKKTKK
ncbi:MAG: hypothetical protein WBG30_13420, partial [Psychrilyobacter sp.]|uniref:hypothetical protein n=1 Tax=Psychrilyobacter sp. TaxID=2586924 RepID=UPI003C70C1F8